MAVTREQLNAEYEASYRENVVGFHQGLNHTHRMGAVMNFAGCAMAGIVIGVGSITAGHRVLPLMCGLFSLVTVAGGWLGKQLATVAPGAERRFPLPFNRDLIVRGVTYRRVDGNPDRLADFEMVSTRAEWSTVPR